MLDINFRNRFNKLILILFSLLLISYQRSSYAAIENYLRMDKNLGGLILEIPHAPNIDEAMLKEIATVIGKQHPSVVSFRLMAKSFRIDGGSSFTPNIFSMLVHSLAINSMLTELVLGRHSRIGANDKPININRDEAQILIKFLLNNRTLTKLIIGVICELDSTQAIVLAIAQLLESNTRLKILNLCGNNIENKGVKDIANALKSNTTLTKINLSFNNISDEGAQALAHVLGINAAIIIINLRGNNIGIAGAQALAHALEQNTVLTTLDLRGNDIGDQTLQTINFALERNRLLGELATSLTPNILYNQLDQMPMDIINIITGYATASPSANLLSIVMDGSINQNLDAATLNAQQALINRIREQQGNFQEGLRVLRGSGASSNSSTTTSTTAVSSSSSPSGSSGNWPCSNSQAFRNI